MKIARYLCLSVLCFSIQASSFDYCYYKGCYLFAQDNNQQFLGYITDNEYVSNSIVNQYGTYGSQYSTTSIINEYSQYGSEYGMYSAYNKYASSPPVICEYRSDGNYYAIAYLTKNTAKTPRVDPDLLLATMLNGCYIEVKSSPKFRGSQHDYFKEKRIYTLNGRVITAGKPGVAAKNLRSVKNGIVITK